MFHTSLIPGSIPIIKKCIGKSWYIQQILLHIPLLFPLSVSSNLDFPCSPYRSCAGNAKSTLLSFAFLITISKRKVHTRSPAFRLDSLDSNLYPLRRLFCSTQ